MVARSLQRSVDATENSCTRVPDLRHLAVDRRRAHDFAPESLPDRLMAKTDTEDRDGRSGLADKVETDAGFIWSTGAWRKHDCFRLRRHHFADRNFIVAMHGNVGLQPCQIMEEVEGEAVVIVDEDDHVPPCCQGFTVGPEGGQAACFGGGYWPRLAALAKRRASSAARNSAFALLMHSCCSKSGSLSATMPAPACTYILPSLINAVRSTMHVSISPAAEKYPTHPA